jgi:O-antigen/teichoic acid export membrane protein
MYQKTSELKNLKQPIHKTVLNVILVLSVLSLIILILMLITSEPLIIFLLGKDWAASGVYIRIMAVYFAFRLISAPIATIPFVISKQKLFLLISSIGNLLGLLTFWIAASFGYDDTFVLGAYALLMSAYYVVFVLQVYVQSKNLKL